MRTSLHCQVKQVIFLSFLGCPRVANSLSRVQQLRRARESTVMGSSRRQCPKRRKQVFHLESYSEIHWTNFVTLWQTGAQYWWRKPASYKHPTVFTSHESALWNWSNYNPEVQQGSSLCFPKTQTTTLQLFKVYKAAKHVMQTVTMLPLSSKVTFTSLQLGNVQWY